MNCKILWLKGEKEKRRKGEKVKRRRGKENT
jgi:hypothetical protein